MSMKREREREKREPGPWYDPKWLEVAINNVELSA